MRRLIDGAPLFGIAGAYWLGGWVARLVARPSADFLLREWDLRLFGAIPGLWMQQHLPRPALDGLELFYFSYYLFVPLAPLLIFVRHGRTGLWQLWISGGLAYAVCDLISPWFPSTPPRLLWSGFASGGWPQAMNLFVLNRFSIGANVFPSSHVAGTTAFALCHCRHGSCWFLPWALGIAASTVSGGYHYGVDAAAGIAAALAADWGGAEIFRRLRTSRTKALEQRPAPKSN
ncbi:MAG TPA: phosphatase PAP2 family protein [Bryobacterales bacterium]|nr:phosphatase PAP2 family protein [Bryobacterales bacterium]